MASQRFGIPRVCMVRIEKALQLKLFCWLPADAHTTLHLCGWYIFKWCRFYGRRKRWRTDWRNIFAYRYGWGCVRRNSNTNQQIHALRDGRIITSVLRTGKAEVMANVFILSNRKLPPDSITVVDDFVHSTPGRIFRWRNRPSERGIVVRPPLIDALIV